ncbi:hypothetical protein ACFZB9_31770 [Kitasatospora sp. NPDC008050]|uniref:hypothetical protein n=1 Tax=Kitasatospora sp. NPDC008050 TaxID=3364021 RepID=UPI0036ED130B
MEAARRAGGLHLAAASSSSVHGADRELPEREIMRAEPLSPYAAGKPAAFGDLTAAALAGRPLTVECFRTQPAAGAS